MTDWTNSCITDVPGIRLGHHTMSKRSTGCSVLLFEDSACAGVDVRGAAPGTRETDLLDPINFVDRIHAIVLSGGSAYGLSSAQGVMQYLEENRRGFALGQGVIPIVPAAVLMDLEVGDFNIRPDAQAGYLACQAATTTPSQQGNVGAGAGASVGKMFGMAHAMKAGLGTASHTIPGTNIVIGAIVTVNAVGDVYAPDSSQILAGARSEDGHTFRNTAQTLMQGHSLANLASSNTTIGAIATNVALNKAQLKKIAAMAHDGFARTINPIHTMWDGDTIFAVSTAKQSVKDADITTLGTIAAIVMAQAIIKATIYAQGMPELNLPAHRDMPVQLSH